MQRSLRTDDIEGTLILFIKKLFKGAKPRSEIFVNKRNYQQLASTNNSSNLNDNKILKKNKLRNPLFFSSDLLFNENEVKII